MESYEVFVQDGIAYVAVHKGGRVVCYASVNDTDLERVMQFRWTLSSNGYAIRAIRNGDHGCRHMHRFILGLTKGQEGRVDHRDGDPLNNTRANLRLGDASGNGQNRSAQWRPKFGYRGTYRNARGRWTAYATLNRRRRALGSFSREVDAALVAASFRANHMPCSIEAERRQRGLPILYQGPYGLGASRAAWRNKHAASVSDREVVALCVQQGCDQPVL
jgi:hypothetical protein